jgi:hypothetical protein
MVKRLSIPRVRSMAASTTRRVCSSPRLATPSSARERYWRGPSRRVLRAGGSSSSSSTEDGTVELRSVATAVTRVLAMELDQPAFAVDKLGMLPSDTAAAPEVVWVVRNLT